MNDIETPESPAAAGCRAPASGYAEWRERAEIRLAGMKRRWWKLKDEKERLTGEIHELEHVMGNGASGGTVWTLHNAKLSHTDTKL